MFEGYAGTTESGFRAEVESEQALARGEQLMEMVDNHQHLQLAGPAADEAARRLEGLGGDARYQGSVIVDPVRLRRLMRRHDRGIYPGKYVTCVHDPTKALCERARHGGSEGLPDNGGCQPLACRNVALPVANIDALRHEYRTADARLAGPPPLPPLLTHRLSARRDEIAVFLDNKRQARHHRDPAGRGAARTTGPKSTRRAAR